MQYIEDCLEYLIFVFLNNIKDLFNYLENLKMIYKLNLKLFFSFNTKIFLLRSLLNLKLMYKSLTYKQLVWRCALVQVNFVISLCILLIFNF